MPEAVRQFVQIILLCSLQVSALLALVCASHSGEAFHQVGVRRILYDSGEDESVLQTPQDWPLDERERETVMRNGAA